MIRFSIVIPTLNSEKVIASNLETIVPQVLLHNDVELIILNNGSSDDTEAIIHGYVNNTERIKYICRENTIPAEQNFLDGVNQTDGQYVLLLGDDDILSPAFIDTVLPYLDGEIGLFYYNRLLCYNNFRENQLFDKSLGESCYKRYDRFADFLIEYNAGFNFMSSVIFHKKVWERGVIKCPFDKPYYGYYWYATLVFGAVDYPCAYYYLPLVLQRVRDHEWGEKWPLYKIVGLSSIFRDIEPFVYGIQERWAKVMREDYYNFLGVLRGITVNKDFYKTKENEFKEFLTGPEFFIYKCLLYVPSIIGKTISKLYGLLHKSNNIH